MTDIRPRRPRRATAAALACAALLTTACGGEATVGETAGQQSPASTTTATSQATSSSAAAATTSSSPPAATGTVVTTGDSPYGAMLFDARNQAIYLFDAEGDGTPACYDDCAADWPPVLTDGAPQPGGQVQGGLLGTAARSDGTTQVTYGGHPLYFYAHEDPGQVLCHDVDEYGGTWLVVTPEGSAAPT